MPASRHSPLLAFYRRIDRHEADFVKTFVRTLRFSLFHLCFPFKSRETCNGISFDAGLFQLCGATDGDRREKRSSGLWNWIVCACYVQCIIVSQQRDKKTELFWLYLFLYRTGDVMTLYALLSPQVSAALEENRNALLPCTCQSSRRPSHVRFSSCC